MFRVILFTMIKQSQVIKSSRSGMQISQVHVSFKTAPPPAGGDAGVGIPAQGDDLPEVLDFGAREAIDFRVDDDDAIDVEE